MTKCSVLQQQAMISAETILDNFRKIMKQMVIYVDTKDGADLSKLLQLARSFASAPLSVEPGDFTKEIRATRVFIASQMPQCYERDAVIAFLKATSKFANLKMNAKKYKMLFEQFILQEIANKDWKETTILMIILYKMADSDEQKDRWLIQIAKTTSLRLKHFISPKTSLTRAKKAISIGVHPEKVYLVTYDNGQRNWLVQKEMKGLHESHYRMLRWTKPERYIIQTNGEQGVQFSKIPIIDAGMQTLK